MSAPGRGWSAAPGGPGGGPRPHVAVVGAGLAGLAAGLALTRAGCRVTVLERSRLLGGKATSFVTGGREVDNGQHVILGCCTAFLELAEELGMRRELHLQERFEVLMLSESGPARLRALDLPAPLHLALPFLRFRALGARARMAVTWALLAARRSDPEREETEPFTAWLARHHQGAEARRAFWEPFVVPAVNAPLGAVSAAAALFVVRTAFLGDSGAARIGWATVPLARFAERAAGRLDAVRLRSAVTGVEVAGGRLRALRVGAEAGGSEELDEVDAAVIAIPPERLRRLRGLDALGVRDLEGFRSQPIVDVHLLYEGAAPLGFEFAALTGSPVQWVFTKGEGYLCCSLSSAAEWIGEPEERLVALADRELRRRVPALAGARLAHGAATRDPEATFVPAPGLHRPGPRTALPNVVLAGAWTDTGWPATMEGAVRSGRRAAAALLGTLGAPRARPAETVHA